MQRPGIIAAVPPSPGLPSAAVHALSNHLSVILGFVELVLNDTAPDHPHRRDLLEIRDAAMQAASLIAPPPDGSWRG